MNARRRWTNEEIEFLKENYEMNRNELARKLNRSFSSIDNKRAKLNLYKTDFNEIELTKELKEDLFNKDLYSYDIAKKYGLKTRDIAHLRFKLGKPFKKKYISSQEIPKEISNQILDLLKAGYKKKDIFNKISKPYNRYVLISKEINRLLEKYPDLQYKGWSKNEKNLLLNKDLTSSELSEIFNKNLSLVYNQRYRLRTKDKFKSNSRRFWSEQDHAKLIDLYNKGYSMLDIAKEFNVTSNSITTQLYHLSKQGLVKRHGTNNRISDEEIQFIKNNYKKMPGTEISKKLNRSNVTIYKYINIFKNEEEVK